MCHPPELAYALLMALFATACTPGGHCYVPGQCDTGQSGPTWDTGGNAGDDRGWMQEPVTWAVEDAVFDDGTALWGELVFDATLGLAGNWALCTEASPSNADSFPAVNYLATTSKQIEIDEMLVLNTQEVYGSFSNSYRSLRLAVLPALTAGGTLGDTVSLVGSYECTNCAGSRYLVEGTLVVVDEGDASASCD